MRRGCWSWPPLWPPLWPPRIPPAGPPVPPTPEREVSAQDRAWPPGLPATGLWMIDPQGLPASWLGETLRGRGLREPINVILHDRVSQSPEEATGLLLSSVTQAGYPPRALHSSGYRGLIGDQRYAQQPQSGDLAFSSAPWWQSNNHARIFGPAPGADGDGFVWTTSVSREDFVLFAALHHPYRSFHRAREDFARQLTRAGVFTEQRRVWLDNALNTPDLMTGDHDGHAVVLCTGR